MARAPRRKRKKAPPFWHTLRSLGIVLLADADDDIEELEALSILALAVKQRREASRSGKHGPRGSYDARKAEEFLDMLLYDWSDRKFKTWLRMDRERFWHVHDLIKHDAVFQSRGRRPQRPVAFQLATFLIRVGGETSEKAGDVTAVAEGTTYLYCDRVCRAIRHLKTAHLAWPGPERRAFIKEFMEERGFPGCIGICDGTFFRLLDKPWKNGFAYWCRKKFYALVMQAICDHRGIVIDFELGWPGSVSDSTIFKESEVWRDRRRFFSTDEYILVDKGYPLTKYTIRPFADYDLTNDAAEAVRRQKWNQKLSSVRIAVEHCFGRLKGRFPILRGIGGHILRMVFRMIEALLILHNILDEMHDDPTTIDGFNGREDPEVLEMQEEVREQQGDGLSADALYNSGVLRRKLLLNMM